ncbi:pentapeptide repeat-containing protein [Mesorhizobium sp. CO1-1-7]|uniref:pentapeptide repeat-containing protein n=1 Tax=Mesorhizobium sp. CO1-1-7 TaxID=2876632 RepID=UPI00112EE5A8|nr:pentapeptide repeat-containing protein [Mesorhizobium sp. CO1-1-7]TPL82860.1 hypothetical protein FJ950_21185 [Mesorhizobium sp. B2-3-14]
MTASAASVRAARLVRTDLARADLESTDLARTDLERMSLSLCRRERDRAPI